MPRPGAQPDPTSRDPEDPPLRSRARRRAALGALRGPGRARRPPARRAALGEVEPRRFADLPALLRARRVRLRCDADQRRQQAGVQGAGPGPGRPGRRDQRRADQGPAGQQGSAGRHGPVLRVLPRRAALARSPTATSRPASACSHRKSASVSTTRPSASCAPPAPRPARSSGTTAPTSARRRSSTPTASSSTAATPAPRSASRSSTTARASGAAARPSTAPTPARAGSR